MNKDIWSEIVKYLPTTVYITKIRHQYDPEHYILNKCYRDEKEAKTEIIKIVKEIIYGGNKNYTTEELYNLSHNYQTDFRKYLMKKNMDIISLYFPGTSIFWSLFDIYSSEEIINICKKNYLEHLTQDIMEMPYRKRRNIEMAFMSFKWTNKYCVELEKYVFC